MNSTTKLEVAICTVPMTGHMVPLLPFAAELVRRGHGVTFFHEQAPKYRSKLEQSGITDVHSVTCSGENWKSSGAIYTAVKAFYKRKPKPDLVLYDFFAFDGADAADSLGVPAIGVFPNPRSINPWAASVLEQSSLSWKLWNAGMWVLQGILARILWMVRNYRRL